MNIIDWMLNVAAVFLWIDWRSDRTARPQPSVSIASTVRPAGSGKRRGLGSLAVLIVILLVRPLFYHSLGPAIGWTASTNFVAIAIPWRSDLLGLIYIYSTLSFLIALGFYYSWLFLLAAVNRTASAPEEDVMHRFVRGQLGWLHRIPWWLKLFVPSLAAAAGWIGLSFVLVQLELIPAAQSGRALAGQAGAFAIAAVLSWKWLLIFIFLTHMLNLYVYLGTHPLWPYLSAFARKLLFPFSFLRFGKIDLSPVAGAAAVFALANLVLKPLVIAIFQRNIV